MNFGQQQDRGYLGRGIRPKHCATDCVLGKTTTGITVYKITSKMFALHIGGVTAPAMNKIKAFCRRANVKLVNLTPTVPIIKKVFLVCCFTFTRDGGVRLTA